MRMLRIPALLLAIQLPLLTPPVPTLAGNCQFVLGFKSFHDLMPGIVGDCVATGHHNPQNGDGLQETTNGLLAWRKADNVTAFTDSYHPWVGGPFGLPERLNTETFRWDAGSASCTLTSEDFAHPCGEGIFHNPRRFSLSVMISRR
jgi:hypothetical protein